MLPNLLGLDPGGTTGWCLWTPHDGKYYFEQIDTSLEDGSDLWILKRRILTLWQQLTRTPALFRTGQTLPSQQLRIIMERFEFRHEERFRDKIDYKAREVIGVVKVACWEIWQEGQIAQRDLQLDMQGASEAKYFWDEDKLRRVGLWKSRNAETKHSQDALKHVLYNRTFTLGDQTLLYKLKPIGVKP